MLSPLVVPSAYANGKVVAYLILEDNGSVGVTYIHDVRESTVHAEYRQARMHSEK